MPFETLEPFSRNVADEILSAFPAWRALAAAVSSDGEDVLRIVVPSPVANVDHPLTIDTSDHEITVSYDYHHGHYDTFRDSGSREGAASFLAPLLNEEMAVASFWNGEKWCGSTQFRIGEPEDPIGMLSASRIRVRSWRGTYDKDGPA